MKSCIRWNLKILRYTLCRHRESRGNIQRVYEQNSRNNIDGTFATDWIKMAEFFRFRSTKALLGKRQEINAYVSLFMHHGIKISVARRGCPWENGYAESLIRTLKKEEVHLYAYDDIHEARDRIGHFITQVYHHKRPHSALGYLTPMEFQRKNWS